MANHYICLLHYPILNKYQEVITTAVTNFDIHDIARSAKTYGIKEYFIVHPVQEQVEMVKHLISHWQTGYGATFNPDRKNALDNVSIVTNFDEMVEKVKLIEGVAPKTVFTTAKMGESVFSYSDMRKEIEKNQHPLLFVFGTGHGIVESFFDRADYVLAPINGPTDYNHLCVRAAVSIILDRLFGC